MTRLYVALIRGTHRWKRAFRIFLSGHPVLAYPGPYRLPSIVREDHFVLFTK